MVVSADKSISLVNTASGEVVAKQDGAHKMGIIDLCFAEEWEFFSASSDATIKQWKIDVAGKAISLVKTLSLTDADNEDTAPTEKFDR